MARSEQPRSNSPPASSPDERFVQRLDSWKEIASHLNRSEKTVRRWEQSEGLPVHRLLHEKRGTVYAYSHELESWWESRQPHEAVSAEPLNQQLHGAERDLVIAGTAKQDHPDIRVPPLDERDDTGGLQTVEPTSGPWAQSTRRRLAALIITILLVMFGLATARYVGSVRDSILQRSSPVQ